MHSQTPSKTIPEFRPKSQSLYPAPDLRPKSAKSTPFGAAHTYEANIRELAPSLPAPSWTQPVLTQPH